jgi:hypothetical protein
VPQHWAQHRLPQQAQTASNMRASEFIAETRTIGKMSDRQRMSTRGVSKFRDPGGYDRTYELNRIMMATACADGTTPLKIDAESWSGRYNTAHPYTDIESKMLKQAFKAVGSDYVDLNNGDDASEELASTDTVSPIKAFRGYKR